MSIVDSSNGECSQFDLVGGGGGAEQIGPRGDQSSAARPDGRRSPQNMQVKRPLLFGLTVLLFTAITFRNEVLTLSSDGATIWATPRRFEAVAEVAGNGTQPATLTYAVDTTPKPVNTLVHFDPYFMGGFRNQHMRFVAFVAFAVKHNIKQLLLQSLRWCDPENMFRSIAHENIFDVEYWNELAESYGLPLLVHYDPDVLEVVVKGSGEAVRCFNETSGLYSGMDEALLRSHTTNLRRTDTWQMIGQGPFKHCRRDLRRENDPDRIMKEAEQDDSTNTTYQYTLLVPHGGQKSSGRLWHEYEALQNGRTGINNVTIGNTTYATYPEHVDIEKAMYKLMRPSAPIRSVIRDKVKSSLPEDKNDPHLLALHPRVEPKMLRHRCAKFMEPRLSKIFDRIRNFTHLCSNDANLNLTTCSFDAVFLAIGAPQIEETAGRTDLETIVIENSETLHEVRAHGVFGNIPIFESGTDSARQVKLHVVSRVNGTSSVKVMPAEHTGVLELVASILNFFTAVEADAFIGVKGSSYSTDVMSVRWYLEKGDNYIVGPTGIKQLYGPAPPHSCN